MLNRSNLLLSKKAKPKQVTFYYQQSTRIFRSVYVTYGNESFRLRIELNTGDSAYKEVDYNGDTCKIDTGGNSITILPNTLSVSKRGSVYTVTGIQPGGYVDIYA